MAIGSVGVVMAISKILDAFTDVIFGNVIDHSRGGNKKYYRWMISLAVPAAAIVALMCMIPANAANGVQVAYALITNLLLTAVIYTMILQLSATGHQSADVRSLQRLRPGEAAASDSKRDRRTPRGQSRRINTEKKEIRYVCC